MGRQKEWFVTMFTLYLLHLRQEGEGANRVVLELKLRCLPNRDNTVYFQNQCNASITYLLGEGNMTAFYKYYLNVFGSYFFPQGKLTSIWPPNVTVGYFGKHFAYAVDCSNNATIYHGYGHTPATMERTKRILEKDRHHQTVTVHSHLDHHRFYECVLKSQSSNYHSGTKNTAGLQLLCSGETRDNDAIFPETITWLTSNSRDHVTECNHTGSARSSCVSKTRKHDPRRSNLRIDLLHLQSEVFICQQDGMGLIQNDNTFSVWLRSMGKLLPKQQQPTQPATAFSHQSDLFITQSLMSTHIEPMPTVTNLSEQMDSTVSIPNTWHSVEDVALHTVHNRVRGHTPSVSDSTLIVAVSAAAAAGMTAMVVIVLLIIRYLRHRRGDQHISNASVHTSLFRLPRKRRSRPNNYVGLGDRLLSDIEGTSSPRAMRRFGNSSLRYSDRWEINRSHITQLTPTGEGCYGRVLACKLAGLGHTDTSKAAIKTAKRSSDRTGRQDLVTEALVMRRVGNDEHILKLLGVCTRGGPLWLVMELTPFGNLRHYLRSRRPCDIDPLGVVSVPENSNAIIMTEERLLRYALQIAKGMKYLISKECLHSNLCARSVLVFDDDQLKLSNFGVVKEKDYHDYYSDVAPDLSPVKWQSPETFLREEYSEYSDVWSFGVLMWEIATLGGTPYPGVALESLRDLIVLSSYRMQRPRNCSRRVYSLMTSCWLISSHQRPKFIVLTVKILKILSEIERENNPVTASVDEDYVEVPEEPPGKADC